MAKVGSVWIQTRQLIMESFDLVTGSQVSIDGKGMVKQPFIYRTSNSAWIKLTYQALPLNYAYGVGGWNGTEYLGI